MANLLKAALPVCRARLWSRYAASDASTEDFLKMDRVIRVHVLDKHGRPIPDATVSLFVNGAYVGKATSGSDNAGTVYTFQINNTEEDVSLRAEYDGEDPQDVILAPEANDWVFSFKNVEVPVSGIKPFWQEHLPGLFGVMFLVISILLAVFFSDPTKFQQRVFIGTLAVAIAGIGSEIPGFLNVKLSLGTRLTITAAGALAIFVLVYFFGPG